MALRPLIVRATVFALLLAPLSISQLAANVTVLGVMDPFLAGQPPGTTHLCLPSSCDVVPAQSPLLVPLTIVPGESLRFLNAGGLAANDPGWALMPPEGGVINFACSPALGISGYPGMPVVAIIGVFLPNTTNSGPPPPSLDFSTSASRDFAVLAPALFQVFFIGNGLRNDGVTPQNFVVPSGATRLFLGVGDSGLWNNNVGSFTLVVTRTFAYPLMAFPDVQSVPSGATLGLQVAGPAGAPVALMFDPVAQSIPVPPYGTIGVGIPPQATADGIGLGFPGSIPMPLTIGSQGILYFSYGPIPAFLVGTTLHAQAVAVDTSFAGGVALSTHGNAALLSPACQVTFVP
jgi:hypothetical protein